MSNQIHTFFILTKLDLTPRDSVPLRPRYERFVPLIPARYSGQNDPIKTVFLIEKYRNGRYSIIGMVCMKTVDSKIEFQSASSCTISRFWATGLSFLIKCSLELQEVSAVDAFINFENMFYKVELRC